jgi:hypothetical protein
MPTTKKGQLMKNITRFIAVAGVGVSLVALAKADEVLQFNTLPQVVQSSVIKETRITPTRVVRVIQDNGAYAVTYIGDTGQQVIYVSPTGSILQSPTNRVRETTTTTTTEQPNTVVESTGPEAVVTTQEVQQTPSRYELIKKEGNKEWYLDHQTGRKVKVERK